MQPARNGEAEGGDRRLEGHPVVGDELVAALHAAHRGFDGGGTGIFEGFAGAKVRMLADHAFTHHLHHFSVGIRDEPAPAQKFCRYRSGIFHGHGVGEGVTVRLRLGLLAQINGLDLHLKFPRLVFHGLTP
jgi:hypothetical protein